MVVTFIYNKTYNINNTWEKTTIAHSFILCDNELYIEKLTGIKYMK